MSFFNLSMLGYQNPIKQCQVDNLNDHLPPINCPKEYKGHFSKQIDSNLKYHEMRTKHIREPRGEYNIIQLIYNRQFIYYYSNIYLDPIDMYKRPLNTSHEIGDFYLKT